VETPRWSMSSRSRDARPTPVMPSGWPCWLGPVCCTALSPPGQLRELRLISRQHQKLVGLLASEKNRLHKVRTFGGIRLGGSGQRCSRPIGPRHGEGSDSGGRSERGPAVGQPPPEGRPREELFNALQPPATPLGTCGRPRAVKSAPRTCAEPPEARLGLTGPRLKTTLPPEITRLNFLSYRETVMSLGLILIILLVIFLLGGFSGRFGGYGYGYGHGGIGAIGIILIILVVLVLTGRL
jgi:hypothetical protein